MLLNELFNAPVSIDVTVNDDENFVTRADINGNEYEFNAGKVLTHLGNSWDFEFSIVEVDEDGQEQRSYQLTNKSEEFKVWSFVWQSLEQLIAAQDPDRLIFSAAKQKTKTLKDGTPKEKFRTRADTYEKIFKRVKGYKLNRNVGAYSDKFTLTKIKG